MLWLPTACIAAIALPHYDGSMSFSETIFLFFLALIVFGPKKLPEIARQAGRLLAELRRASNEFRSQIETEIAHLEVKDSQNKQTVLPPAAPPQGAVASLSLNPASEAVKQEAPATLAEPAGEAVATPVTSTALDSTPDSTSTPASEVVTPSHSDSAPVAQDSHV